jgi:hypothetical protein
MVLVGDVSERTAIIVDDMADTCGTLVKAADVVIQHGAKDAIAIVTHGILSGNAIEALNGSKLKKIVVTNTVPHAEKKERCDRIETIDISPTVSAVAPLLKTVANFIASLRKHVDGPTTARVYLFCSSTLRLIDRLPALLLDNLKFRSVHFGVFTTDLHRTGDLIFTGAVERHGA